ncbi:thiol peroxidase [Streptococcus vestibularis F0396]|uniref:Thiol peroxidase n=1 Tax=Streptococcus vestibularis F0396 TaxID=904306 RepID=E3CPD5_STRVE|nr:thiol peroxidase [Streptococcus vestibularis F0396]
MPTFIGKPVTVAEDKQLQVGDTLRDFNLTTTDLTKKSLSEFDGKKKLSLSFHQSILVFVQLKHVPLTRNCQN